MFADGDKLTCFVEREGKWLIARCPEVPGANGQGRTLKECPENLKEAVKLVREVLAQDHVE